MVEAVAGGVRTGVGSETRSRSPHVTGVSAVTVGTGNSEGAGLVRTEGIEGIEGIEGTEEVAARTTSEHPLTLHPARWPSCWIGPSDGPVEGLAHPLGCAPFPSLSPGFYSCLAL